MIAQFLGASLALLFVAGCGSLTTSPGWVGGGLAIEGPERMAAEEAQSAADRQRLASQPHQVGARHLVVMHEGSRNHPDNVTRTRAQARARAEEALAKIRAGAPFEEIVKEYTDEPSGAERGGDLGVFDRGSMVKAFSDAAFGMRVGEVSNVVETQFGFHVIKRTE